MNTKLLDYREILTKNNIDLFLNFKNYYFESEKGPYRHYQFFIGIAMSHYRDYQKYLEQNIFKKFPWLDSTVRFALDEIIQNVQSSTLRQSLLMLANAQSEEEKSISDNCFFVEMTVSEKFMDLTILEHGGIFDYINYLDKLMVLREKIKSDPSYFLEKQKLSPVPKTFLLTADGQIEEKCSHGLGLDAVEMISNDDFYITTIEFDGTEKFSKTIHLRFENKNYIATNVFSKKIIEQLLKFKDKIIVQGNNFYLFNIGLTSHNLAGLWGVLKSKILERPWLLKKEPEIFQVVQRAIASSQRQEIQSIYNNIDNKYSLVLPFLTVGFWLDDVKLELEIIENNDIFPLDKHYKQFKKMIKKGELNLQEDVYLEKEENYHLNDSYIIFNPEKLEQHYYPDQFDLLRTVSQHGGEFESYKVMIKNKRSPLLAGRWIIIRYKKEK